MLRKYLISYLVTIAVLLGVSLLAGDIQFLAFYPCILSCMIPVSILGFDERSGWDRYSAVLPYSRAQIVSAKFIIGLVVQMIVLIAVVGTQVLRLCHTGELRIDALVSLTEMLITLSFLSSSLPLPFMFRYGVEKGRMAYIIAIGLVTGGSMMISSLFEEMSHSNYFLMNAQFVFCLVAIGCYILSWLMSIRFYQKREF